MGAGEGHMLALADDGRVYAWGGAEAAYAGALGLGTSVGGLSKFVTSPQRVPALRMPCVL